MLWKKFGHGRSGVEGVRWQIGGSRTTFLYKNCRSKTVQSSYWSSVIEAFVSTQKLSLCARKSNNKQNIQLTSANCNVHQCSDELKNKHLISCSWRASHSQSQQTLYRRQNCPEKNDLFGHVEVLLSLSISNQGPSDPNILTRYD